MIRRVFIPPTVQGIVVSFLTRFWKWLLIIICHFRRREGIANTHLLLLLLWLRRRSAMMTIEIIIVLMRMMLMRSWR